MPRENENDLCDEKDLVARLKKRDEEAFRILIRLYQHKIYGIALGISLDREESLDIVQEVLVKIYEKIDTFKEESRLSTWIHRITVNHCLNWKRKWKRRFRWHHHSLDRDEAGQSSELPSKEGPPDVLFHTKSLRRQLWTALGNLPEEARAVFVLKEFEDLSYDEIAETLGIKKGTVSSRLYYARERLRNALQPYLDEESKP